MALDNKISNIIGTHLPTWLLDQIEHRAIEGAKDSRDNNNILYITNKTAWVRLVSSINLVNESDRRYFNSILGGSESDESYLAKQFVLFGGTSKYLQKNSYQLRSGLGKDNAYGILGDTEIQKYGYKPMPGITNVAIETQGRLGSVRSATINFKCWDKQQLDIIDALYFKLGFTMFLEWGNTFYSTKKNPDLLQSTELLSIDPFQANLSKEQIFIQIAKNSRASEGNYDGMLGVVTNFSFSYTQDGGFDCQLRLMALGSLAESIKINNVGILPGLVEEEIRRLNNTLIQISTSQNQNQAGTDKPADPLEFKPEPPNLLQKIVLDRGLEYIPFSNSSVLPKTFAELTKTQSGLSVFNTIGLKSNSPISQDAKKALRQDAFKNSSNFIIFPSNAGFYISNQNQWKTLEESKFEELDYYTTSYVNKNKTYTIGRLGVIITPDNNYSNIVLDIKKLKSRIESAPNVFSEFQSKAAVLTDQYSGRNPNAVKKSLSDIILSTEEAVTEIQANRSPNPYGVDSNNSAQSQTGKSYSLKYKNEIGSYFFNIKISNNVRNSLGLVLRESDYKDIINSIFSQDLFSSPKLNFKDSKFFKTETGASFSLNYEYDYAIDRTTQNVNKFTGALDPQKARVNGIVDVQLIFNDSSIFANIDAQDEYLKLANYKSYNEKIASQNQKETNTEEEQAKQKKALETQIREAITSQSNLELTLRAIQLHALNKAIEKSGLDIAKLVYTLDLSSDVEKSFVSQIFSNGIFSSFINELIAGNINISEYNSDKISRLDRLKIQSKYGFATSLMGDSAEIDKLSPCNFKDLLKAYVVPYQINQEIIKGTSTNHPVYISLGFLLMILNHSCTIYDSNATADVQTPLVYIDFNTEHNYFLSNTKQLSTNPWVTLIPFEGGFKDYKKLFQNNILDGDNISPPSGSQEIISLFNPETSDVLSGQLPKIKFDQSGNNLYRGKLMNVLINIDYLINTVKDYSYKDGTNSIYLKQFIEQILVDVNKYLGNINVLRLSYNDKGNTFQIIDDQFIPVKDEETQMDSKPTRRTGTVLPLSNTTELPLFGKYSIAKSLDIKSDISNKLANTIAISANANVGSKATLSKNGDNYGYINTSYQDRYITNRQEAATGSNQQVNLDSIKNSAMQFNQTIADFYSTINPSETTVAHATNYYIDAMTKIKNNEYPTRASAMIPVSVNFTTDGISGFLMGQGFTIPDELLPYTYNSRIVPGEQGLTEDHLNKVGFVVVGVNHILENNQWTTAIRANMIFLKDKTEFSGSVDQITPKNAQFGINENRSVSTTIGRVSIADINTNQNWELIAFDFISKKEGFLEKPKDDEGTLRAGYGTDKIVLSTGEIKSVGSDTVFTREDGKRTLIYQIKTTFAPKVISQIGIDKWNTLNDKQKAALVSFTYNVGSLTKAVIAAILSNTGSTTVANAIIKGPVTGQKSGFLQALADRRKQEAALYLS